VTSGLVAPAPLTELLQQKYVRKESRFCDLCVTACNERHLVVGANRTTDVWTGGVQCCQVMLAVCSGDGDVSMTRFELCEVHYKCASLSLHTTRRKLHCTVLSLLLFSVRLCTFSLVMSDTVCT